MGFVRRLRHFSCVLAAILAMTVGWNTDLAAQSHAGTGQIVGTVYDATGALVPNAKITVNNKGTGLTREDTANEQGGYRFILLPIGFYSVTFSHPGFKTHKTEVEVTVGAAVTVNAELAIGDVSQVVEVTASALIESTQAQSDALIGVRPIEELPINGRRFHDFVTLTPTVQIEPQRNGISFSGQRGINGNVTIDGADYNEPFFGGVRGGERANNAFTIPQEAISQFQSVPSGYSVEFGRSTGGILNATTKSGTNEVHGSAFFFARHGTLAANDAFNREAISALYQEGGSVGGAIKRDKLFYFAAFENQKNDNPRVVIFRQLPSAPTALQREAFNFLKGLESPFTQSNDALTGLGRLDFQINPNHRVTARYHYSKNTGENAVSTGDAISPETSRAQSNNGTEGDRTNTVTGQWTALFSPRVILETRGQYSLENRPRTPNAIQTGITSTIGTTGTRDFLPTTLDDYRVQISSNLTWTRGTHAFKFGGEYNYLHADQLFMFNQFGVFSISGSVADIGRILQTMSFNPGPGGNNRFDDRAVFYRVNIGNGQVAAALKQAAVFLQDTWRVTPRVTLTAGFRWEGYVNPQPDVSNTAFYNQVKNFPFPIGQTVDPASIPNNYRQFMPRLGIAWDPRGNAKTVIRANAGLFYAPTPLLLFAGPLNNFRTPAGDLSVQLPLAVPAANPCKTVWCQLNLIGVNLNNFSLTTLPTITPAQITAIATALGLPSPNPYAGAAPITMANNYESPRSWQWSVGAEHEIARGWSVGADFVYVNTVHLERNRNLNLPPPIVCRSLATPGCTAVDLSLRPCYGVAGGSSCSQTRPIAGLNDVTLRSSEARSFYRGATFRTNFHRGRYQFQTYYTLSYNYSSDDNERSAGGFDYDNSFDLSSEYGFSRLDARHLLLVNGLVDLPGGVTISALGRFRSARPLDPVTGTDSNGDNNRFGDRAYQAPGVPFQRNSFRDRRVYNVDLRIAKKFKLPREGMSFAVTADLFNVFNFANVVYVGGTSGPNQQYGVGVDSAGNVVAPRSQFQRLRNPTACALNKGCYDTFNTPGAPFTAQLGVRFQF